MGVQSDSKCNIEFKMWKGLKKKLNCHPKSSCVSLLLVILFSKVRTVSQKHLWKCDVYPLITLEIPLNFHIRDVWEPCSKIKCWVHNCSAINRACNNLVDPDQNTSDAVDVRSELDLRIGKWIVRSILCFIDCCRFCFKT